MCTFQILAVALPCLALNGCIYDNGPSDEDVVDDEVEVQVGFRIRLNDRYGYPSAKTRSGEALLPPDYNDDSKYVLGTGHENYVGITAYDYSFMLFDENGKFVENMTVLSVLSTGNDANSADYIVYCSLSKKPGPTFKVVALANWGLGNYPQAPSLVEGVTTIADVCQAATYRNVYAYNTPFVPSPQTPIPLYGVKTCNMTLVAGKYNDLGDIYLLRAMAKVEVVCKQGVQLELASVTLQGYNTKGFCAPSGMDANTIYASETHIPDGALAGETDILDFALSPDKDKAVIYIPEYRNTDAAPCVLTVTFADNTGKHYPVEFREYINGAPEGNRFDIVRNCYYRFTVDRMTDFEVDVVPYGKVWLEPSFGLD